MITIDDARTRDMDDAIEVEETTDGWIVRVAIADASRLVTPGSELDVAARARGNTLYFGTGNSPMLPREIGEWQLSLWPGKTKHAITVEMRLSQNLGLDETTLSLGKIVSAHKVAYAQVPSLLAGAPAVEDLGPLLNSARKLALGLLKKRRESGALVFYDLNNGWVTTEEGSVKKLKDHTETIGYIIVQELMVLANTAVALYAIDHKLPMLFRNHETRGGSAPDREEIQALIASGAENPVIDLESFQHRTHKLFKKAEYGSMLTGHAGLSVPAYLHFTSPIRRYADLVVHQQLRSHLKGEPLPHSEEGLAAVAAHLNELAKKDVESNRAHFKGRDESQAKKQVEARKLDGLNAKQFERVVKVEVRSGESPSEALVEAWERRLVDGSVPTICMTTVLMLGIEVDGTGLKRVPVADGWDVIKTLTIGYLAEHTPEAISILAQAGALGWPDVRIDIVSTGPAHAPRCTGSVAIKLDGGLVRGISVGKTVRVAEQRAAVCLLAELAMVATPQFEALEPLPPAPVIEAKPRLDLNKHPVSQLMERSQAERQPPPKFDFTVKGEAHLPVVTCTASFLGTTVSAVAASKQEAKTAAAKLLLEKVE